MGKAEKEVFIYRSKKIFRVFVVFNDLKKYFHFDFRKFNVGFLFLFMMTLCEEDCS